LKRLLDHDPLTGVTRYFHYDSATKTCAIESVQDVTAILDQNKAMATHDDKGWSKTREFRRVASIPNIIQEQWIKTYGVDPLAKGNDGLLRRLLNSSEWAYLRTAPGRL
jgi:hypothetical protein